MALLAELASFTSGGTPSRAKPEYFQGDIPWVTGADLGDHGAISPRSFITEDAVANSAVSVVEPGALLLVTRTSVGKVAITDRPLGFSQDITAIIADQSKVDTAYLAAFLRSYGPTLAREARGATIKGVTRNEVERIDIPLPPLPEQRRIASILDQADGLRAKRRSTLARLHEMGDGMFTDHFGPMERTTAVGLLELCQAKSGGTPSKAKGEYWGGSVPWFTPKDMKATDLWDSIDHINETAVRSTKLTFFPKDTVAVVVRGMILAHSFPVACLRVPGTINQDMKALIPKRETDAQFLAHAIRAQARDILDVVSTAGHGTKRLDTEGLGSIQVPEVPLGAQRAFGRRVRETQALIDTHRAHLAKLDELFASLQSRAFKGEL